MITKKTLLPICCILVVTCLIFFKIFTKGLYPVPGDLLTSFYFPYYSGGWEGYNPWTTHKELLDSDSIRQIYLWKEFAATEFKKGKYPAWNPYTFSGQPLLANFQSSVFYPLNIFYFITNSKNAWIILIISQPFLGGLFIYLFTKSLKISNIASTFAAITFMFSSYLITWMENGNISHSYIWLPLTMLSVQEYFKNKKKRYLLLLLISLTFSILAGHPQTAIYIYFATAAFWLYKLIETKDKLLLGTIPLLFSFVGSLTLSAIQIFPTYNFYKISPIALPFAREVFDRSILPYKNLITFFASDFFGHPANNNFWSQTYGDFTPYIGVVPFIFTLWAIFHLFKNKLVKYSIVISALFILSAVHSPITFLIKTLKIPLIDATTPARFLSITIFMFVILSAIGFDDLLTNFNKNQYKIKFLLFLGVVALVYFLMWLFTFTGLKFLHPADVWRTNMLVTRRNLILPSLMFISIPLFTLLSIYISKIGILSKNQIKIFFISAIILVTCMGGVYYTNKFMPVSPKSYIFPDHPLFSWLKNNAGIDRFYGGGTTHIDFNFPTHYNIYTPEGYDTLRIERYSQLLASSFSGRVPSVYARSDGVLPDEENGFRKRIFDLLGVKYILDKEDDPKPGDNFKVNKFSSDEVTGYWQDGKFLVYKRETVLPRIFQTTSYVIVSDDQIIKNIYDSDFSLKTLQLEKEPTININTNLSQIEIPKLINYSAGHIELQSNLDYNSLLFISDAHEKDWNLYIDNKKETILRAHYAFLAAAIPAGNHLVTFRYESKALAEGSYFTIASILILICLSLYWYKTKKL